ncbi:hypothetical protein V6N13_126989 [Hibiscus sabdariffa]|uniref:Uncharacterized protein n=1 Tax=Hibiscus sabdariffa TaxID=183260 RepID=A0ABR2RE43_9ROSI
MPHNVSVADSDVVCTDQLASIVQEPLDSAVRDLSQQGGAVFQPHPTADVESQQCVIRSDVNPPSPIRGSGSDVQQQDVVSEMHVQCDSGAQQQDIDSEVPIQCQVLADGFHQSEGSGYPQNAVIPTDILNDSNSANMLDQNLNDDRSGAVSQGYEVSEGQEVGSSRDHVQSDVEFHRIVSLPLLPILQVHVVFRIKV